MLYVFVTFVMMAAVDGEWWLSSDAVREDPIFAFVDAVTSTNIGLALATLAFLTMISGALSGLLAASRSYLRWQKTPILIRWRIQTRSLTHLIGL